MSDILVRRGHGLTLKRARQAAEKVAAHLQEEFDLACDWDGNTVHFKRAGVAGHLAVTKTDVEISVRLGFLLLPLRAHIEQEIHAHCDKEFGHPKGTTHI